MRSAMAPGLPGDRAPLIRADEAPAPRAGSSKPLLLCVAAAMTAAMAAAASPLGEVAISRQRAGAATRRFSEGATTATQRREADLPGSAAPATPEPGPAVNVVCAPPVPNFGWPHRGCPTESISSCLANNDNYATFVDAWIVCGTIPECGAITRWTNDRYYLRRQSDPDRAIPGAASMLYACTEQPVAEVALAEAAAAGISEANTPVEAPAEAATEGTGEATAPINAPAETASEAADGIAPPLGAPAEAAADGYGQAASPAETPAEAAAEAASEAAPPPQACSPPEESFDLSQKGCPTDSMSSCVANNKNYATFADAWAACGAIPECGVIMRWTDGGYFLRRSSDPDFPVSGAASMLYSCTA